MENKLNNNIKKIRRIITLLGIFLLVIIVGSTIFNLLRKTPQEDSPTISSSQQETPVAINQSDQELSLTFETAVFKIKVNSNYAKNITTDNVEDTYEGDLALRTAIDSRHYRSILIQKIPKNNFTDISTYMQNYLENRTASIEKALETKDRHQKSNAITVGYKQTLIESTRVITIWEENGSFYMITVDEDLLDPSQTANAVSQSIATINTLTQNLEIKN